MFRPQLLAGIAAAILAAGCGVFRPHHTVSVQVIDGETRRPIPDAKVGVYYPNMLDFTAPLPAESRTDAQGFAKVRVGEYHSIHIYALFDGYLWPDGVRLNEQSLKELARRTQPNLTIEMWADPQPTAELVVPNGYRGAVKVICERDDSAPIPHGKRHFTFPVEPNGRVIIRGPGLLTSRDGPEFTARYVDGTAIPTHSSRYSEVALRWLASRTWRDRNTQLFCIGTETEGEVIRQSVHERIDYNTWRDDHEAYDRLFSE